MRMLGGTRTSSAIWLLPAALVGLVAGVMLITRPTYLWAAIGLVIVAMTLICPAKRSLVGTLGSIAIVVAVVFPAQYVPTLMRYAELLIFLAIIVTIVVRRGPDILQPVVPLLLLVYLVITGWATFENSIDGAVFQFWMHAIIATTFALVGAKATVEERLQILKTVTIMSLIQAGYAVLEIAFSPPLLWANAVPGLTRDDGMRLSNELIAGLDRAQGTFGHPLPLGLMLVVTVGIVVRYPLFARRVTYWVLALLFAGILATGSRSALVVSLLILCYMGIQRRRGNIDGLSRFARGSFVVALLIGLAGALGFFNSDAFRSFVGGGSASHRAGALSAVPQLFEQDFHHVMIGHGWYSVAWMFENGLLQTDGFHAVDNQFVALLVTGGVVGLLLFLTIAYVTLFRGDPSLRPAAFGVFAMFWVFDIYQWPASWALIVLVIGMASASPTSGRTRAAIPRRSRPAPTVCLQSTSSATPVRAR